MVVIDRHCSFAFYLYLYISLSLSLYLFNLSDENASPPGLNTGSLALQLYGRQSYNANRCSHRVSSGQQ
jgi:hypothetical protein